MNWELVRGGPLWRIATCHFTHFTYEQLAWDGLAFLALAAVCLRRDAKSFLATLLASVIIVPLAVLAFTNVDVYRGLSGIDSALFALLVARDRRLRLLLVPFAAKLAFEIATGSTLFVSSMGAGVVAVPVAHAAGAMVGVFIAMSSRAMTGAHDMHLQCVDAHPSGRARGADAGHYDAGVVADGR